MHMPGGSEAREFVYEIPILPELFSWGFLEGIVSREMGKSLTLAFSDIE